MEDVSETNLPSISSSKPACNALWQNEGARKMEHKSPRLTLLPAPPANVAITHVPAIKQDPHVEWSHKRAAMIKSWTEVQDSADNLFTSIPYEVRVPSVELGTVPINGVKYVLRVFRRTFATSVEEIELCRRQFPFPESDAINGHFDGLIEKLRASLAYAKNEEDRVGYTEKEEYSGILRKNIFDLEDRILRTPASTLTGLTIQLQLLNEEASDHYLSKDNRISLKNIAARLSKLADDFS